MQTTLNSFNILDKLEIDLETKSNPFNFDTEDLFLMGARVNPKRSFLFISKLLGKHLAVHPCIPKIAGYLLANLIVKAHTGKYFSNVDRLADAIRDEKRIPIATLEFLNFHYLREKTLFTGFAETATGLGNAVFSAFRNAYFVHTTREQFRNKQSIFNFEEEHSHATKHFCYLDDQSVLAGVSRIVLVDDEITTGKTCLNLIKEINNRYQCKESSVLV